ncbi:MAG: DUF4037 domain-containing protein [Clostridiales bacterium]|nr:DUF4037 domain-containing protein [Clostridiales bacterium]
MNGMELSRRYFFDVAEPPLRRAYPDLYERLAAGLVGNGSECFGYDDEISRDHDWGVDFFLWVPEGDRNAIPALREWKDRLFAANPPAFPRTRSQYGAGIGVMTAGDFYKSLIGYPDGPDEIQDWRRIPEENLAMAVNGGVFIDNGGFFSATRRKLLGYYPEDLRKKKLAARCMAIAQTGQYNLSRCYLRQDWVTFRSVLTRFSDNVISAAFLLNRIYRPYYKWAYRKMTELPILGTAVGVKLNEIARLCTLDTQSYKALQGDVAEICALLAEELRRQQLAFTDDWFLTTHGEEIQNSIQNDFLRSLPAQYE